MESIDFTWVIPNTRWYEKRYWNHIPYVEGILTAVMRREGFSVNVIDANVEDLSHEQLFSRIASLAPSIVGVSCMSVEYKKSSHSCFDVVKSVSPHITTIMGGVYPSISKDAAFKDQNIDYLVVGEGEERLPKLLRAIQASSGFENVDGLMYRENGKVIDNPQHSVGIENLDSNPFPDYSDYDMEKLMNWGAKYVHQFQYKQFPVGVMMTSRGCPYRCTYCAAGKDLNPINDRKNVRTRSPESILKEIDYMRESFGMRELIMVDDSLLIPSERAIGFMKGMAKQREQGSDLIWKSINLDIRHVNEEILDWMKASGCYQLSFSLESGSKNTLKRMKRGYSMKKGIEMLKAMRKRGWEEICSNFIIGLPGDTWDDIRETFNFADNLRRDGLLDYVLFSIATPLPGTELADTALAGGYLPDDFDPDEFYGFGKGMITTEHFTPMELQVLRAYEWDRINFRSEEDKIRTARMLGITLKELDVWRQETRRETGVHVSSADTTDVEQEENSKLVELAT
ncbi:MAG: B12-binding domain-containing radical SAM protein [Nitrospina sp.]|jgi:anaerobic magnesium-protoporphyrin IX monomethyl ester cyclase|nr:B12-binding domain-containing radical SAM protein [Nitrospina sp.]MBT3508158.1 B12-binding domain-containing radical SAM protein [Nitrospina sp.]MBT3876260.1 B12-binding domain-containing radical SAM protein [Nitrospina sp.]MBT4047975.1 B12-binding domain-containing radical SAM protein [Nitrospina sp.]MBT4555934.1 B12-binding domain-containing radical SAM protein [Nitrospina sp.]